MRYSGRPAWSRNNKNVATVCRVITSGQDVTTEQTANKNDILYGSVQNILKKDLSGQRMCIKSVKPSYKGSDGVQKGDCC